MKYSERFLKIPVRIYDRFSTKRAEEAERDAGAPMEGDWVEGCVRVPYKEIILWNDYFDSAQGVDGVIEKGFNSTLVWTEKDGMFVCILKREKFEALLDSFSEVYDKWEQDQIEARYKQLKSIGVETIEI